MKKQIILSLSGLLLVLVLFFFGRTVPPKSKMPVSPPLTSKAFNINELISEIKSKLPPNQVLALDNLENSVKRGDIQQQQVVNQTRLANFWKDSIHAFEPYAYYLAEAAKLDKSEKTSPLQPNYF
ncbi:MAG: hypothetical protein IPI66_01405 [Chitinophagaceae bacterium]|nr:hypothetical protein [Chitinophagaceae bacterium]